MTQIAYRVRHDISAKIGIERIGRLVRYAGVSAISTSVSLIVLASLIDTRRSSAGWANVIATAVGTIPSFELNRRWVWRKRGKRSIVAEVGPFCALSFLGLAISTLAVSVGTEWATSDHLSNGLRTIVAVGSNVTAFGVLWVIQFVLLDRVLFNKR